MSSGSRRCRHQKKCKRHPSGDRGRHAVCLHRLVRHRRQDDDGLHPRDIHKVAEPLAQKPFAVGANCGVGASDILASMLEMTDAEPEANVIVKGNCGIPEYRGAEIYYSGTPELMSDYARLAIDGGARIIGGCCGTSYGHLAAMRHAIDTHHKRARPTLAEVVEKIGPLATRLRQSKAAKCAASAPGKKGLRPKPPFRPARQFRR